MHTISNVYTDVCFVVSELAGLQSFVVDWCTAGEGVVSDITRIHQSFVCTVVLHKDFVSVLWPDCCLQWCHFHVLGLESGFVDLRKLLFFQVGRCTVCITGLTSTNLKASNPFTYLHLSTLQPRPLSSHYNIGSWPETKVTPILPSIPPMSLAIGFWGPTIVNSTGAKLILMWANLRSWKAGSVFFCLIFFRADLSWEIVYSLYLQKSSAWMECAGSQLWTPNRPNRHMGKLYWPQTSLLDRSRGEIPEMTLSHFGIGTIGTYEEAFQRN